nr:hypothetical protein [Tanacetum cinerariifolium]
MENANPPPTSNRPVLPVLLRAQAVQELHELQRISTFVDSCLESIEQFINNFTNHPNETNMNYRKSDDESVDTPFVFPFPHSDNDSDDGEVLNELIKYENVGMLRREKAINSYDGDDLAFQCMVRFRNFVAYFDPFLPINIITHKAYNTIMVEELESTWKNLVAIVRDVYVFVGYLIITHSRCPALYLSLSVEGTFHGEIPPILVLSQRDLTNGFKNANEKNKFMYKNCLNLGLEYRVDESMKEWLIHGHVSIHKVMLYLMRISLKVLRKFHSIILEGRFNQLSHVSSPLLSKPGEY